MDLQGDAGNAHDVDTLWRIPEHRADPEQRRVLTALRQGTSNAWVKGFVGTGKTQVLYWFAEGLTQNRKDDGPVDICFVLFTRSLTGLIDYCLCDSAKKIRLKTVHQFMQETSTHDLILIDEVQDLTVSELHSARKRCRRLIVAGDFSQSIYPDRVRQSSIYGLIRGKVLPLTVTHRLSKTLAEVAREFFPSAGVIPPRASSSNGAGFEIVAAPDEGKEVATVWDLASTFTKVEKQRARSEEEMRRNEGSVAILLPSKKSMVEFCKILYRQLTREEWEPRLDEWGNVVYRDLNQAFLKKNFRIQYFGGKTGSIERAARRDWINLMTYHSSKGLDFRAVFLPFLSSTADLFFDPGIARRMMFVALTRGRENVICSYSGRPHPYLDGLARFSARQQDSLVF